MAQSVAIADFLTAVAGCVTPADGTQQAIVATSESLLYQISFQQEQGVSESIFARLDEGIIYGVAAYVTPDGVQHAVAATSEGNVYHIAGGSQEKQLLATFEGAIFSAVAGYAAPSDDTQFAVVALGDGSVHHIAFSGQGVIRQRQLDVFESSVISLAGYVNPADNAQYIFVAAGDGNLHSLKIAPDHLVSQHWLCHFAESYISMTSYITPADGLIHIIPATRDGKLYRVTLDPARVQEVFVEVHDGRVTFKPADTQDVAVGYIRFYELTSASMMSIAGYVTPADGLQHILVAASEGAIHHFFFPSWPASIHESAHEVIAQFQSMF
ncbi:MAG: hypothetical protein IMW89_04350 [Ktedonobacteraceae bacterium]|nr:hypothetical protein [Ktedonobacteraceae bacterium]